MSRLLIKKDEMILLKNSEAGKNNELYGNLYDVLQPYDILNEDDFQKNILFNDKARAVILNNKSILIDAIKEEWFGIAYNDEATDEIHCQLCGRKNKLIFYIRNKLNDIELNVGSDCIKKFPGIENISNIKRTYNEHKKQLSESKRTIEFDQIDLNNLNYIKQSEKWFSDFKIVLPYQLHTNIKSVIYDLNSTRTMYIKNGGDLVAVQQQYIEYKNSLEKYKQTAEEIYQTNRANKLVCKKELADWLHINHNDILEKVMKNGGLLSEETLKYCYYDKFVQSNLKIFNSRISDKDINIVGMNGNLVRFVIENNDYTLPLFFCIKSDNFMRNIGCYCLTNKTYTFGKSNLTNLNIEQTHENFNALCNRISAPLEKIGLTIERGQYSNDIFYVRLPKIKNASNSKNIEYYTLGYKKASESAIYSKLNNLIFDSDQTIESFFAKIFNQLNRSEWITHEEKQSMEELSKSLSIQKQRDFVPYS